MLATITYAGGHAHAASADALPQHVDQLTVGWTPPATPTQYQLHLEARRRDRVGDGDEAAAAGIHSLFWDGLPENSRCCFRVAAVAEVVHGGEVRYSRRRASTRARGRVPRRRRRRRAACCSAWCSASRSRSARSPAAPVGGARGMKQLLRPTGGYPADDVGGRASSSCRGAEHAEPAQPSRAAARAGRRRRGGSGAAASAPPA